MKQEDIEKIVEEVGEVFVKYEMSQSQALTALALLSVSACTANEDEGDVELYVNNFLALMATTSRMAVTVACKEYKITPEYFQKILNKAQEKILKDMENDTNN